MKKLLNKLITSLSVLMFLALPALAPVSVYAAAGNIEGSLCQGAGLSVNTTSTTACAENDDKLNSILTLVINIFSIVVGFFSVVMIIVGGLKYIMSGGESSNISGAKNTILYAIIGLVVVALAQIIVRFVLARVSTG